MYDEAIKNARRNLTMLEFELEPENKSDLYFEPDALAIARHANSVIHSMNDILNRVEGTV